MCTIRFRRKDLLNCGDLPKLIVFSYQTRKRALDADEEDVSSSNKRSNIHIDLSPGQKGVPSPDGEEQQDRCSNTTELTGAVSMTSTVTSRSHSRDST